MREYGRQNSLPSEELLEDVLTGVQELLISDFYNFTYLIKRIRCLKE